MARLHSLKFQTTVPASLTRTPHEALKRVIDTAAETLRRMVPHAYDIDFKPIYKERKVKKLGWVWDLLVVMQFNHKGPLPPNVAQLKLHHDISKNLTKGN